ncbi:hypothetical protein HK104_006680, partial [Borealophlyctis nickersoniae]
MDKSHVVDLDRELLRGLGVTEGDILRIKKASTNVAGVSNAAVARQQQREMLAQQQNLARLGIKPSDARLAQIQSDEEMARRIQAQELRGGGGGGGLGAVSRRSSRTSATGTVNFDTIQQASSLLQATNKKPSPGASPPGTPDRRPSGNNIPMPLGHLRTQTSNTTFAAPPSTQHASHSNSLGLRSLSQTSSQASNDPWSVGSSSPAPPAPPRGIPTASAKAAAQSSGSSTPSIAPATQSALLDAQRKQTETQQALLQAQQALRQAQEQARQAALIQEQTKAAEAQRLAAQQALAIAQETARQAALIQAQTQQALLAAQQAQNAPKPAVLPPPLIPTPTTGAGAGGFVPVGGTRPTTGFGGSMPQQQQQQQMGQMGGMGMGMNSMNAGVNSTMQSGMGRPNWSGATPNAPFGMNARPNMTMPQTSLPQTTLSTSMSGFSQPQLTSSSPMMGSQFNANNMGMGGDRYAALKGMGTSGGGQSNPMAFQSTQQSSFNSLGGGMGGMGMTTSTHPVTSSMAFNNPSMGGGLGMGSMGSTTPGTPSSFGSAPGTPGSAYGNNTP